ncbi:MAG TPA: HD domain-containing protein, partial [Flavipsychrobacter sp.]
MQFGEAKKFILAKLKNELPKHLSYHSVEHVRDVFDSCKSIAAGENIKGEDLKLLLTAALFHDTGFLKGP